MPSSDTPTNVKRCFEVPLIPKAFNSQNWGHWAAKHRERQRIGKAILAIPKGPWFGCRRARLSDGMLILECDKPPKMAATKVRIHLTVYRKGLQDPTNARASVKGLEDAIVNRGWAVDDTAEWLELTVEERIDWKNTRTEITWEAVRHIVAPPEKG